jgi:type II secretory ATPase GspE/PulE/Tfp pilus assembly ATPase PilB-like protein
MLAINDAVRAALAQQPKLEVLRQLARQAGCRSQQEEGIVLVARGITSLNELQRVLKQ